MSYARRRHRQTGRLELGNRTLRSVARLILGTLNRMGELRYPGGRPALFQKIQAKWGKSHPADVELFRRVLA